MITKQKIWKATGHCHPAKDRMSGSWTYQDYLELDDDKRYEVIEGYLIEMPSPRIIHQRILLKLSHNIVNYLLKHQIGEVFISPYDVILSEISILQPDLIFISKDQQNIIKEKNIDGVPDLVIEILSPSNRDHDKVKKFKLYEKHKVKEYWIVDPDKHSIEIFTLENNKLLSFCSVKNEENVKSKVFKEIDTCFEDLY